VPTLTREQVKKFSKGMRFGYFIPLREAVGSEAMTDDDARTARVVIITEGLGNLRDRNFYAKSAVASCAEVFNGKQFYLDHPSKIDEENRPERSVRDLAGYFFDTQVGTIPDAESGEGLSACFATLKFAESEPGLLAYSQVKTALEYQKRFPNEKDVFCGISINGGGVSHPDKINGMPVNMVTEIKEAFSADIVTKPARGGKFLAMMQESAKLAKVLRTSRETGVRAKREREVKEQFSEARKAVAADAKRRMLSGEGLKGIGDKMGRLVSAINKPPDDPDDLIKDIQGDLDALNDLMADVKNLNKQAKASKAAEKAAEKENEMAREKEGRKAAEKERGREGERREDERRERKEDERGREGERREDEKHEKREDERGREDERREDERREDERREDAAPWGAEDRHAMDDKKNTDDNESEDDDEDLGMRAGYEDEDDEDDEDDDDYAGVHGSPDKSGVMDAGEPGGEKDPHDDSVSVGKHEKNPKAASETRMKYQCEACEHENKVLPPKGFKLARQEEYATESAKGYQKLVTRLRRAMEAKEARFMKVNTDRRNLLQENIKLRAQVQAFTRMAEAKKALKEAGVPKDILSPVDLLAFEPHQWPTQIKAAKRVLENENKIINRGGRVPSGGTMREADAGRDAVATFREGYRK